MEIFTRLNAAYIFILSCLFLAVSGASAHHHTDSIKKDIEFNTTELEAFMDGVILAYMEKQQLAGATVGILHKSEVLLLKGYGYANVEKQIPVDPETTLFRIASISKLFTWIAVLQQLEKGRLDLDEDINNYIKAFSIPETFEEPLTLRSLMSHTPGFEDIILELFIREDQPIPGLEEIFRKRLPKRIMPPLQETAYSNHGSGLAQYLVELASGMPFEDYVEKNILFPLGMYCTTFRQPIPEQLAANMSNGYAVRNGRFVAQDFEIVPMAGGGGATTSAHDMLIFMDALLNNARKDTISLMDSATYAIMKKPVLTSAPGMNPALHGFMDMSPIHLEMIGHGGNLFYFHSLLALFPEYDLGVFMSFNSENGAMTYADVINQFINRYFPNTDHPTPIELDKEYLQGFTGQYVPNRRPHSDLLKLTGFMNILKIWEEDNKLHTLNPAGKLLTMVPVDSTTFYVEENDFLVGFLRPEGQKAKKLYLGNRPIIAFDRITGLYRPVYHIILLAITLIAMLYILIIWPWMYFVRRNYDRPPRTAHPLPLFSKIVAWLAALCFLVFHMLLLISFSNGSDIVFGVPGSLKVALAFPLASIPFILLMIWNSIAIWKSKNFRTLSQLFYNLATIAFIISIWQLHFWNLLGWKL